MSSNNILQAATAYLLSNDWKQTNKIEGKFKVFKRDLDDAIIVLPDEIALQSDGGQSMLHKALEFISKEYFSDVSEALYFLNNPDHDLFNMRLVGDNIEHGKIDIDSGGSFLFSYTSFIKKSILSFIKDKKEAKNYIKNISLLTPKPGSFIYQIQLPILNDIQKNLNEKDHSIGREINESIILKIHFLWLYKTTRRLFINHDDSIQKLLIEHGITIAILDSWIEMLSIDLSKFEFSFHMSILENTNLKIAFSSKRFDFQKSDISHFKELKVILEKSNEINLTFATAIVEGNIWHTDEDKGKVKLQVYVDEVKYRVEHEVERDDYEKLKNLKARSKIFIDGTLSLHKKGRIKAELKEVRRIHINNSEGQMDLFIE